MGIHLDSEVYTAFTNLYPYLREGAEKAMEEMTEAARNEVTHYVAQALHKRIKEIEGHLEVLDAFNNQ